MAALQAVSFMPHLTVLVHADQHQQTKNFETGATYAKTKRILAVRELRFTKLRELKRHVENLQSESASCVIRGVQRSDSPDGPLRRRRTHFEDVATTWVMLDIDSLRLPKWLRAKQEYTDEHAQYAITQLPDEFQGVSCVWQASASAGRDIKQLKLHLWFMLDAPLTAAQLRVWLKDCSTIDPSTLRSVQPHYTAAPIGSSYTGPRVGLLRGAIKRVPVPPDLAPAAEHSSSVNIPVRAEGTADVTLQAIKSARKKANKRSQEALDNCSVAYKTAYDIGAILGPSVALETWNDVEHGHETWKASAGAAVARWAPLVHAVPGTRHGVELYEARCLSGIEWGVARERERLNTRSQAVIDRQLAVTAALRERLLTQLITHAGSEAKLKEIGKQLGRYTAYMTPELKTHVIEVMQANSGFSEQQVTEALETGEADAPDNAEAWREGLLTSGKHHDEIVACDGNILQIYKRYPGFLSGFRLNLRTKYVEAHESNLLDLAVGRVDFDALPSMLAEWLQSVGCVKVNALAALSLFRMLLNKMDAYDPFLERYPEALLTPNEANEQLRNIKPRLDDWLIKHFGTKDKDIYRAFGAKTLIAAVARAVKPGSQVDTMLVLEGAQGIGKSQVLRRLGGVIEHGYQELLDMKDKDALIAMNDGLVVEVSELKALRYSQEETAKAFFSRQRDRLRAPFGRVSQDFDRRVVFVGTTNDSEFLSDHQNRRYWPVSCVDTCVMSEKQADRLWREAALRYAAGEQWWLDADEQEAQRIEAGRHRHIDMYELKLEPWLRNKDKVLLTDAATAVSGDGPQAASAFKSVARAMRALGWRTVQLKRGSARVWVRRA